ncbi:sensor histidine kinase [Nonlabens ponticola]|uniref:histidine kinase n=1 Tax=Nonlabens ponticola TaxID=2496866 RepID=A0A3S9N011_9FLAO|nr:sensor histidine kinase [Nonlabens ponticola]AZQ44876.1 sensor histidine kinase [Nonlabens ponticola]
MKVFPTILSFLLLWSCFKAIGQDKTAILPEDPLISQVKVIDSLSLTIDRSIAIDSINALLQDKSFQLAKTDLKILKLKLLVDVALYDEAILLSIELLEKSTIEPEQQVKVLLQRALVYEIQEEMVLSKKDLNRVERIYENGELDRNEDYGEFLYRSASWYRVNDRHNEARRLAMGAFNYGKQFDYKNVTATSLLVLGLITPSDSVQKMREYFTKSLQEYKRHGDEQGIRNMYYLLASSYMMDDQVEMARTYNDSINKEYTFGQSYVMSSVYKQQSEIEEQLGMQQQALESYKLYKLSDDEYKQRARDIRTKELEYQFAVEETVLRNQKLQEQLDDRDRSFNRLLLLLGFLIIFLLLTGLFLFWIYRKNNKIKEQNDSISAINLDLSKTIKRKDFLLKEVNHRVKNNLAFIQSLIGFQIDEATQQETTRNLTGLNNRIQAMSIVHERLIHRTDVASGDTVKIKSYLDDMIDALLQMSNKKVQSSTDFEDFEVNAQTALPLGIIMNELITNSLKHAQPIDNKLKIHVTVTDFEEYVVLTYRDNGVEFLEKQSEDHLGLFIVRSMARQLKGKVQREQSSFVIRLKKKSFR